MSEFRQNPLNHSWVLMAPIRAKKPEDFKTYSVMAGMPEEDPNCVFCPGKEHLNTELFRAPQGKDWQVRVIENKFHALEHTSAYRKKDFYSARSGYGNHEVLITRKHNELLALQSATTIELSFKTLSERAAFLYRDEKIAYVQIFHNHGRDAGASLVHPHYQLLSLPFVPPHIHEELTGAYHYYHNNDHCIYCDIMEEERTVGERLVYESERFVVVCAYASRKPFETWILPKNHASRFEDADEKTLQEMSIVLKWVLERLYIKLSDPPVNFYVHTMPGVHTKHSTYEEESFHWHLTVFPRLTIWGGFEYSAGIPINPILPEETAKFLRG